jgi:hypothetical protein
MERSEDGEELERICTFERGVAKGIGGEAARSTTCIIEVRSPFFAERRSASLEDAHRGYH